MVWLGNHVTTVTRCVSHRPKAGPLHGCPRAPPGAEEWYGAEQREAHMTAHILPAAQTKSVSWGLA